MITRQKIFKILLLVMAACACHAQTYHEKISDQRIIVDKLKQIENSYINRLDFKERREAIRLMDDILRIIRGNPGIIYQNRIVTNHDLITLSEEGFEALLKQVTNTINEDKKNSIIIQTIGEDGYILSAQLAKLLSTYSFDSYKIDCIKKLYSNVYDKPNLGLVYAKISNSILKDELINDLQK